MKHSHAFAFFSGLVFAIGIHTAAAETGTPEQVTIKSLIEDIVAHNPELSVFQDEIAAAKGEQVTASKWMNPEISSSLGNKRVSGGGSSGDGLALSLGLQQTFEWPGRIALREAIAKKQIQMAEMGLSQFKLSVEGRARALGYKLVFAQEMTKATREVSGRFKTLREVLQKRDPTGVIPLLEMRIIESTELITERKVTESELKAETALLELAQLRGESWPHGLAIKSPNMSFHPLPAAETLIAAAEENSFEIQIRKLASEQQGLKVKLAENERNPSITAGPYFSRERASDTEYQVGIGFSVPLSFWNRNEGRIATENARAQQAQNALRVSEQSIRKDVLEKAVIYERKLKEIKQWNPETIDQFRKAAMLADEHYRLGAVPIATYVELQKQYLEAMDSLLNTRSEAIEAEQELQKLTGLEFHSIVSTDLKGGKK